MKSKFERSNFGNNLTDLIDKSVKLAYSVVYFNVSFFLCIQLVKRYFSNPSINQLYLVHIFFKGK